MDWTGLGLGLGMPGMTRQELADLYTLAKQRYVTVVGAASGNPSRTAQMQALATAVAGFLNNAALTNELTRSDVPVTTLVSPEIEAAANSMNIAAYDLETMALNWAKEGMAPVPPEAIVAAEKPPTPSATFTTSVETPKAASSASSESIDRANLMPTGPVATPAAPAPVPAVPAAAAASREDLRVQTLPEVPVPSNIPPPAVVSQREPGVPLWVYLAGGAGLLVAGVGGTWLWMRGR
jgi:hypothetical protein